MLIFLFGLSTDCLQLWCIYVSAIIQSLVRTETESIIFLVIFLSYRNIHDVFSYVWATEGHAGLLSDVVWAFMFLHVMCLHCGGVIAMYCVLSRGVAVLCLCLIHFIICTMDTFINMLVVSQRGNYNSSSSVFFVCVVIQNICYRFFFVKKKVKYLRLYVRFEVVIRQPCRCTVCARQDLKSYPPYSFFGWKCFNKWNFWWPW